jgi:bifunctional N-acetylglutamate synthase/kinase
MNSIGNKINVEYKKYSSFGCIDHGKFRALVSNGFGRELVSDYFESLKPEYVCLAEAGDEYVGAIVVENPCQGIMYLDKIVVACSYQGKGVGSELWEILNGDISSVLWRAKKENPINGFYLKKCEGMQKVVGWNIYWIGLTPSQLEIGIKYALAKKETLVPL